MTTEGINRKLTAILSADAVGYSRLMAEDEVGTVQRLKSYRELISTRVREHHGRVVDSPGDNILAEFPSALDAVRSAVEIQRALKTRNDDLPDNRKMEFRIGIHLGDVMVDGDRIYGDGVNIAARLEGLADPGSICISDMVHNQVKSKLDLEFEDIGNQDVKNIPEPVRAYKISSPLSVSTPIKSESKRISRKAISALAIIILLCVGLVVIWNYALQTKVPTEQAAKTETATVPTEKPSIAVLPFENMSGDPEQEYFSEGMSEEILNGLAKNPELLVKARTSSFSDKVRNQDVKAIAELLNVTHILEGSVRKSGSRIRVIAQLIDTDTDAHIWSERYERELTDIFDIQDDISGKILNALNMHLVDPSQKQIRTNSMEAYNAYLLGRYQIERMQSEEAAASFEKAISLDPNFADAYGMLAQVHNLDIWRFSKPPREKWPIIRRYIDKALTLNPNQSVALMTKLEIRLYTVHDYQDIINKVADFVRQYPNDISILSFYTHVLRTIGQTDLAIRINDHIVELDPLSPLMQGGRGRTLLADGYYDEARESFERCEMLGDNQAIMFANIAFYEEDAKALQQILDRDWPDWLVVGWQCNKAALSYLKGDHKKVKEILAPLWQTTSYISFVQKCQMAFLERDLDLAFDYYEQALSESDYTAFLLARAKFWAKSVYRDIYSHPRYQKMLRKVGLDDESVAKLKIPPLPF